MEVRKTDIFPTIFLDIDGVLTNINDRSSYLCEDPKTYRLSKTNLSNLKMILDRCPDSRVVISSNWRRFIGDKPCWEFRGKIFYGLLPELRKILKPWIVGDLTHERYLSKSEAMELWFEDNPRFSKTLGKYVILEDDVQREGFSLHPIFYKHLIATSKDQGLTAKDASKAISML